MTEITLHNTATRAREPFEPLDPANVRMYVCGPTVYDRAHLGNARPAVVFDVLYRLLRHAARENGWSKVTYVRNITDVDDKINARAAEMKAGGDARSLEDIIRAVTDETTRWFLDDMAALGTRKPDHMPRATEYVPQMVALIERLAADGFAYAAEGHVLFRVRKYERYGALSGRSVDDMISGARVEVAPYKEDPLDFVLWKPSTHDLPGWPGPVIDGRQVGRGRPGWHIECSAMAHELLGESFDIHGGGIDLQFPHHENEIAQSCCGYPSGDFARVWLHNEMLQVEGRKMSKSLGNFFTVRDLLEGRGPGGRRIPGEVIRFVLLGTHYRKPMDWTERKVEEFEVVLRRWRAMTDRVAPSEVAPEVVDALADDLNTPAAMAALHDLAKEGKAEMLSASAKLLGLLQDENDDWFYSHVSTSTRGDTDLWAADAAIQPFVARWQAHRAAKDFKSADELKAKLSEVGVALRVTAAGPEFAVSSTFDPDKLVDLD